MPRFLLSIVQPDGPPPPPEVLEPIMRDLHALNGELRAAGALVLTAGLEPPALARTIRPAAGGCVVTDGPFAESREHLGGFWILDLPDPAAAEGWATRAATALTLPVEVRGMREG